MIGGSIWIQICAGVLAASLLYSVSKPCGSLVAFHSSMLQFSHIAFTKEVKKPYNSVNSYSSIICAYTQPLLVSFIHQVGCSAGVYALTTSHLASILLNWREDSLVLR